MNFTFLSIFSWIITVPIVLFSITDTRHHHRRHRGGYLPRKRWFWNCYFNDVINYMGCFMDRKFPTINLVKGENFWWIDDGGGGGSGGGDAALAIVYSKYTIFFLYFLFVHQFFFFFGANIIVLFEGFVIGLKYELIIRKKKGIRSGLGLKVGEAGDSLRREHIDTQHSIAFIYRLYWIMISFSFLRFDSLC